MPPSHRAADKSCWGAYELFGKKAMSNKQKSIERVESANDITFHVCNWSTRVAGHGGFLLGLIGTDCGDWNHWGVATYYGTLNKSRLLAYFTSLYHSSTHTDTAAGKKGRLSLITHRFLTDTGGCSPRDVWVCVGVGVLCVCVCVCAILQNT